MEAGDCETHYSKTAVVQNRQIASRVLCHRRCLDAVFWRLMHRCERQCSESVPCGDCLFCTTEAFENIVSQLPNKYGSGERSKVLEMTSRQRAYLKSLANGLDPVFQVGKSSLTPEVTEAISEAFNTRELLKVAVLKNCADDPKEIASIVAERTHSQVVQVIGKKIILYKPDKKNPKIMLERV